MNYKGKIYGKIQGKYVELEEISVSAIDIIEKRIEDLEKKQSKFPFLNNDKSICEEWKSYDIAIGEASTLLKQIKGY